MNAALAEATAAGIPPREQRVGRVGRLGFQARPGGVEARRDVGDALAQPVQRAAYETLR